MIRILPRFNNLSLILFLSSSRGIPVRSFHSTVLASSPNLSRPFGLSSSSTRWRSSSPFGALNMMMSTSVSFEDASSSSSEPTATMFIGKKKVIQDLISSDKLTSITGIDQETAEAVLDAIDGPSGSASTFIKKHKVVIGLIPDKVTRNNHPWSVHSITSMVASDLPSGQTSRLIFAGDNPVEYQGALASAVAKAFSVYSQKTTSTSRKEGKDEENDRKKSRSIQIAFWDKTGTPQATNPEASTAALAAVEGVQLAARLVDMPPEELTTDAYSEECRKLADSLEGVTMTEIVGEDLDNRGIGGIFGVGKAATCPPRLVMLEYNPPGAETTSDAKPICLVGKAIIYDTGGLSLKPKVGMCGMKTDMGGSAGVLGGYIAAVKAKYPQKLVLLLCMAENAIGPTAFRNDDILTLYSGKTVEINNCDAEGRLVLGDGVAYATKHLNPSLVVDMATLTGAQLVATGKKHAGILANTPELEAQAVAAGLKSGDLVYPMLYAPELLQKEFKSPVADMKNSVKDRSNAQSSCAGHFIESHLEEDYDGGWLHVDMAGPATDSERGTGYGVGLVLSLLGVPGF